MPGPIVIGQLRGQPAGEPYRERGDHAVNGQRLAGGGLDAQPAGRVAADLAHLGAQPEGAAGLRDPLRQPIVQPLEAAAQVAQLRGSVVNARPEPGHGDQVGERPELAAQERTPDHVVGPGAHPAADPSGGGVALQPIRAAQRAQVDQSCTHAQPIGQREWAEAQERCRGVQLVGPAVVERHGQGAAPKQLVAQAQLVDQPDGVAVRLEQVVVEAVEPDPRLDLEARGQPAGERLALEDDHLVAALRQAQCDGQAQGAGSQDGGAGHGSSSKASACAGRMMPKSRRSRV